MTCALLLAFLAALISGWFSSFSSRSLAIAVTLISVALLTWVMVPRLRSYFASRVVAVLPEGLYWKVSWLPGRMIPWTEIDHARPYKFRAAVDICIRNSIVKFEVRGVFDRRRQIIEFCDAVQARVHPPPPQAPESPGRHAAQ